MQKNQKKDKNAEKQKKKIKTQKNQKKKIKMQKKQKKEYEPFRWQIVAILINFAPRPKTIEHSTSLFLFSKFFTTVNLYNGRANTKASSLEKISFGTI